MAISEFFPRNERHFVEILTVDQHRGITQCENVRVDVLDVVSVVTNDPTQTSLLNLG